jgi:hypothetical protein
MRQLMMYLKKQIHLLCKSIDGRDTSFEVFVIPFSGDE